jgi:hypothetical protein
MTPIRKSTKHIQNVILMSRIYKTVNMKGLRIYLDPYIRQEVERIRVRDKDRTLGSTARRLIRKSLDSEVSDKAEEG